MKVACDTVKVAGRYFCGVKISFFMLLHAAVLDVKMESRGLLPVALSDGLPSESHVDEREQEDDVYQ